MTAYLDVSLLADGPGSPPRDNGELVFAAPWEARTFAMTLALVAERELSWDEFRSRLIEAITAEPDRAYYESWATALEALVVDLDIATPAGLAAARPTERQPL